MRQFKELIPRRTALPLKLQWLRTAFVISQFASNTFKLDNKLQIIFSALNTFQDSTPGLLVFEVWIPGVLMVKVAFHEEIDEEMLVTPELHTYPRKTYHTTEDHPSA